MNKLIIAVTRGLIRHQHTRRTAMFIILIVALIMLFCGAAFLGGLEREHPLAFIGYWAACAWLTLTAALLAVFDLLAVRGQALRERQRIKAEVAPQRKEDDV